LTRSGRQNANSKQDLVTVTKIVVAGNLHGQFNFLLLQFVRDYALYCLQKPSGRQQKKNSRAWQQQIYVHFYAYFNIKISTKNTTMHFVFNFQEMN
jgi:hypothetical protein